jgi:phosphoribosylaminoimidazole-succinocarboxamide synthase
MGRTPDGRLVLIDEIHTPDSSRFWFKASYEDRMRAGKSPESFDKEYVRRWLAEQGFKGDGPIPTIPNDVKLEAARRYIEACETVQGVPFVPDLEAPGPRLERNLKARL